MARVFPDHVSAVLYLCTALLLIPSSSLEAQSGKRGVVQVPVVVVEPTLELEDEAAPSSVIRRGDLSAAMSDLPAVLEEQPGLRATRLGGVGSFSALSVRGSTGEQVLVYLDGIPLNAAEGGPVDLSSIPLGPLERVVVYRGVAPAVFGRSAMGGVVSLHSRRVVGRHAELEVGAGSFGTRSLRSFMGQGERNWGVGVASDLLSTRGDFSYQHDGGTRFDSQDDEERVRQNNALEQLSLLVKGHRILDSGVTLRALNFMSWRDSGIPSLALHPTERSHVQNFRNLLGLKLEMQGLAGLPGFFSLLPFMSWSQTSLEDPLGEVGLAMPATRDQSLVSGLRFLHRLPLPLDSAGEVLLRNTVSAGAVYERFMPGEGANPRAGRASRRWRLSVVEEVDLLLAPLDLELVGALRVEALGNDLSNPENRQDLVTMPVESASDHGWTARGGFVQRSIADIALKGNLSHSIRFPSLFELFGNTGAVLGNPSLRPERGTNADLGILWAPSWLGPSQVFNLELFGFTRWSEDLIVFIQNAQNISVAQNADKARIYGAEMGSYLDLFTHLRARSSLTWMRSLNEGELKARQGKRLPQVPEWKSYARLEGYARGVLRLKEVGLMADVEAVSGNYLDFANLVEVPQRMLVGVGAYIVAQEGQLRVDISCRNILNDRAQDFSGFPLPGLSVMAALRWTPAMGGATP